MQRERINQMAKHHKGGKNERTGWLRRLLNQRAPDTTVKEGRLVDADDIMQEQKSQYSRWWFSSRWGYHHDPAHEEIKRGRWLERL